MKSSLRVGHAVRQALAITFAVSTLGAVQLASAAPMVLIDGDQITLSRTNAYGGASTGGGEFRAAGVGALSGADSFLTFCVEHNETISLGTAYYVDVNTRAIGGGLGVAGYNSGDANGVTGGAPNGYDPLSFATAWLYTQFRMNTLQSAVNTALSISNFTFSYASNSDADSLQEAIWFLENEQPISALDANAVKMKDAAIAAGWTSIGNVRVINLWDTRNGTAGNYTFSGQHQDQLYLIPDIITTPVPEPESYAMLLAGLGLFGFAARRRKQQAV